MIAIIALIVGAIVGVLVASKRKGNTLDKIQYGAIFAIVFALGAVFGAILLESLI